jgi:hypothetical protein
MNDLHLKYIRKDSAGTPVYEKYLSEDRITLLKPMGELTLTEQLTTNIANEIGSEFKPVTQDACYRNHANVVCKCKRCVGDL